MSSNIMAIWFVNRHANSIDMTVHERLLRSWIHEGILPSVFEGELAMLCFLES